MNNGARRSQRGVGAPWRGDATRVALRGKVIAAVRECFFIERLRMDCCNRYLCCSRRSILPLHTSYGSNVLEACLVVRKCRFHRTDAVTHIAPRVIRPCENQTHRGSSRDLLRTSVTERSIYET